MFDKRRDLFIDLSAVFMDTTSLSFYGEGGESLGENGYSKDYRPDLKQMILGLVVDGSGAPICTEMWPGNTADVTTLLPMIDRLRQRFGIGRVCIVADRGMISGATIAGLEARNLDYILGARERSDAIVKEIVLENSEPFVPLLVERKRGETQLFVKQVKVGDKRYIVCRNEAEADKDRRDREAIIAGLDGQLKRGDKALVNNSAYRRYLRKTQDVKGKRLFEIDAGKVAEEARFDGIFVLRTNAKITPLQAVLRYRDLLNVETLFLRTKAVMRTRPIFHSSDAAIRGHVFCTFLAVTMQHRLEELLRQAGVAPEWKTLLRDLDRLQQVRIQHRGADWLVRTLTPKSIAALLRHAHIALPPRANQTAPPKPQPSITRKRRGRPRRGATSNSNFAVNEINSIFYEKSVFKWGEATRQLSNSWPRGSVRRIGQATSMQHFRVEAICDATRSTGYRLRVRHNLGISMKTRPFSRNSSRRWVLPWSQPAFGPVTNPVRLAFGRSAAAAFSLKVMVADAMRFCH